MRLRYARFSIWRLDPPTRAAELNADAEGTSGIGLEMARPGAPFVAKFGVENGMVPGGVPQCLKDLTMVEVEMIARAHPVVKTFRKLEGQRHFEGLLKRETNHEEASQR